jgi:hypothetical protein
MGQSKAPTCQTTCLIQYCSCFGVELCYANNSRLGNSATKDRVVIRSTADDVFVTRSIRLVVVKAIDIVECLAGGLVGPSTKSSN